METSTATNRQYVGYLWLGLALLQLSLLEFGRWTIDGRKTQGSSWGGSGLEVIKVSRVGKGHADLTRSDPAREVSPDP